MARNCHKSVFNALSLGGIEPVYLRPQVDDRYGVAAEVRACDVAALLDSEPQAAAVILASPNYYGICSDIAAIARETHKRGKLLIVDQAHGAHLKFFANHAPQPFRATLTIRKAVCVFLCRPRRRGRIW